MPKRLSTSRVGALSGGELQRVLLAMALEPLPHILILDEPMSGVDIEAGERQLLDMLDEIRHQLRPVHSALHPRLRHA